MTCSSCVHFTARAAADAAVEPLTRDLSSVGICRRFPPKMTRHAKGHFASLFPNVHRQHACGEYSCEVPL